MAVVATLTGTPVPAVASIGGAPMMLYHQKVTAAGAGGSYRMAHGLSYPPTFCLVTSELGDTVAPTAANSAVGFCPADTDGTYVAFALPGAGTYHVIYG